MKLIDENDIEEMGSLISINKEEKNEEEGEEEKKNEMVTPLQRFSLTKEGYKIVGSHSAVKMCR